MSEGPYRREVEIVERAIALLEAEADTSLITELKEEQLAGATGLEWYGITKGVFERLLASRRISDETRAALKKGVRAVRVIYNKS